MTRARLGLGVSIALLALAGGGCSSASDGARGRLSVLAASSLTELVEDLGRQLEAEQPGVDVRETFAGSHVLRLQIEQGAPADVFASADRAHVDALQRAGLVGPSEVIAEGELVVIVAADDPHAIARFEDLPRARRLVVGEPDVPLGRYTARLLERSRERLGDAFADGVRAAVVSEESNARLVRAKVELREADAAIVYATDARGVPGVRVIPIPAGLGEAARYHAAVVTRAPHPELARAWMALATGERGRERARRHGFRAPLAGP